MTANCRITYSLRALLVAIATLASIAAIASVYYVRPYMDDLEAEAQIERLRGFYRRGRVKWLLYSPIREIDLRDTVATDADLEWLNQMHHLEKLLITKTKISESAAMGFPNIYAIARSGIEDTLREASFTITMNNIGCDELLEETERILQVSVEGRCDGVGRIASLTCEDQSGYNVIDFLFTRNGLRWQIGATRISVEPLSQ